MESLLLVRLQDQTFFPAHWCSACRAIGHEPKLRVRTPLRTSLFSPPTYLGSGGTAGSGGTNTNSWCPSLGGNVGATMHSYTRLSQHSLESGSIAVMQSTRYGIPTPGSTPGSDLFPLHTGAVPAVRYSERSQPRANVNRTWLNISFHWLEERPMKTALEPIVCPYRNFASGRPV